MNQQDVFSGAQLVVFHPILKETPEVRAGYFAYLKTLLRSVNWDKRKYVKAQIKFYQDRLCGGEGPAEKLQRPICDARYCYLIPYDLAIMLGFRSLETQPAKVQHILGKIAQDLMLTEAQAVFLAHEFASALGDSEAWTNVLNSIFSRGFKRYLKLVKRNIDFIREKPRKILITATMSAGKSTLINALVGKNVSHVQNMACTSKLHFIISKPFEDGTVSEYDHDLSLDATQTDLLSDNESNLSDRIAVGTYFHGGLAGQRFVLLDSPGANSSENTEHTEIAKRSIRSKKYGLLLYVLNATNLSSTDEEVHLETVRKYIGRTKVLFIINKADQLLSENEDYLETVENQRRFLVSKGFKDPIICPVSAKAAYLAKKSQQGELTRLELREAENLMDKFDWQSMSEYYVRQLHCSRMMPKSDAEALLINSGFSYLEKVIRYSFS